MLTEKECKYCGEPFTTTRPNKDCCSDDHHKKWVRDQYRSLRLQFEVVPKKKKKKKKKKRIKDPTVVKCEGCTYYRQIVEGTKIWCCNYFLDTGELRGIPPKDCYKKPGTPYTPKQEKPRKKR